MDSSKLSSLISHYFTKEFAIFTAKDFYNYLRWHGVKIPKEQAADILYNSDYVFSLVNQEFITRAAVFSGVWFSFVPTREEIKKNHIIIGHRFMPFVNPDVSPDSYVLFSGRDVVKPETETFSMNLALDTFAFFGEGYVIPYILSDKGNTKVELSSLQYNLPSSITLTAWPLEKLFPHQTVEYGDRILCRVMDWSANFVEVSLIKGNYAERKISAESLKREEWFSVCEKSLLKSFLKHGPASSIEEQLAFLYLENREELGEKACGSIEELVATSKRIKLQPYGLECRLWNAKTSVPYVGRWNAQGKKELVMTEMSMIFTPFVVDAFLENSIYLSSLGKTAPTFEDLIDSIFPNVVSKGSPERKFLLLNLEKRFDILKSSYNAFRDSSVAELRRRCVEFFAQVSGLLCEIGCSPADADDFPQQELVVLTQIYGHLVRLLEDMENELMRESLPAAEVSMSLDGLEETFYDVRDVLVRAVKDNIINRFEIVSDKE